VALKVVLSLPAPILDSQAILSLLLELALVFSALVRTKVALVNNRCLNKVATVAQWVLRAPEATVVANKELLVSNNGVVLSLPVALANKVTASAVTRVRFPNGVFFQCYILAFQREKFCFSL
jgi:hypothetical protein